MKKIYFVRHGETDGNLGSFWQGPDQPLNDEGRRQASLLARRIENLKIDKVFVSSMLRARQTAEIILQDTELAVEVSDLFRELKEPTSACSVDEATTKSEIITKFKEERALHLDDPHWHFEDEENMSDFLVRMKKVFEFLSAQPEQNILVVSHGHVIRHLAGYVVTGGGHSLREAYEFKRRFKTSNTGITVFLEENNEWTLLTWNDHAHFADN